MAIMVAKRMAGRRLQARRLRIWAVNPHCAMCGKLVPHPSGYELDHIQPLKADGGKGKDEDENCQVLCIDIPGTATHIAHIGCHSKKTATDMGYKGVKQTKARFDTSGRVVW
jgi:5-methylcytosine-specific restriction protein A